MPVWSSSVKLVLPLPTALMPLVTAVMMSRKSATSSYVRISLSRNHCWPFGSYRSGSKGEVPGNVIGTLGQSGDLVDVLDDILGLYLSLDRRDREDGGDDGEELELHDSGW